jgi:flagellar hook-basal body complex protein FliE
MTSDALAALAAVPGMTALAAVPGGMAPALTPHALQPTAAVSPAGASAAAPAGFGTHMLRELEQLNQGLLQSEQMLGRYAAGEPVSLHAVMIHLEETRVAFQTLVQFRNKVLEAYQDLMRMQV